MANSKIIDAISISPKQYPSINNSSTEFLNPDISNKPSLGIPHQLLRHGPLYNLTGIPHQQQQMPPGSVHTGCSPRPLGLLPSSKKRKEMWHELGVLIYNGATAEYKSTGENGITRHVRTTSSDHRTPSDHHTTTSWLKVEVKRRNQKPCDTDEDAVDDLEYLNTLALCDLREYNSQMKATAEPHAHLSLGKSFGGLPMLHRQHVFKPVAAGTVGAGGMKTAGNNFAKLRNYYYSQDGKKSKSLEYLSFFGPAQLNKRMMFSDTRNSKDYEPCERCTSRGIRCSHCKAIRTGGGYIILDDLQALDFLGGRKTDSSLGMVDSSAYDNGRWNRRLLSSRGGHRGRSGNNSALGDPIFENEDSYEAGSGADGLARARRNGEFKIAGADDDERMGRRGYRSSYGNGSDGLDAAQSKNRSGANSQDDNDYYGNRNSTYGTNSSNDDPNGRGSSRGYGKNSEHGNSGRKGYNGGDSTAGDSYNQQNGRRTGSGHDLLDSEGGSSAWQHSEDNDGGGELRGKQMQQKHSLEKGKSTRQMKGSETDGNGSGKRKSRGRYGRDSVTDDENGYKKGHGGFVSFSNDTEEEGLSSHYSGDLMRFKSKANKVRAKSCTLRELKGIDPLDYLAKYCIIDQEKVPHYERVFENVDLDKDGEIGVDELDFALKSVNYNLISDAELVYVNKVLELAGRYALNFQLFSLVAALSEKVVSLEDMVKRMVNDMDFDALETKMKKCKELFYLLANQNDDEDGVVTASALGIELHAGGLTQEHVEYVVDHLDHEKKGVIEFLDYLVYVPLFVEIHGSISDNPLDFSRTK